MHLVVVGRPGPGGPTERLAAELALGDKVRFAHGISDGELAELAASAEVAVVPSLYEGFSLPAVEHMASGTPLIVSRTGALPEVVEDTAVGVKPGDPENSLLYRLKKEPAFRAAFLADPATAVAGADLTADERAAFVARDMRRINELGGYLHLVMSIPGLAAH